MRHTLGTEVKQVSCYRIEVPKEYVQANLVGQNKNLRGLTQSEPEKKTNLKLFERFKRC